MSSEKISLAVVDGNRQFLRNMKEYTDLKESIECCDTFDSAAGFLVALQAGYTYEAAVLNDFLPDMHTEKFLQQFRAMNLPAKPALLITLISHDGKRQELLKKLGADVVIQKPVSVVDLLDSVLAMAMDSEQYLQSRVREQIWWVIHEAGIPSSETAYNYLFSAMEFSLRTGVSCAPTKELYAYIKEEYGSSANATESALRRLSEKYIPKDEKVYRELRRELMLKPDEKLTTTRLVSALVQRVVPRMGQYGKELIKQS